jgi:predicted PurR-regulated permease PerM
MMTGGDDHTPLTREVGALPLRLLAFALVTAVLMALPFALQAGSEFFLPLVAALVIATALVPLLEWLERRGLPSGLAALLCVIFFVIIVNGALALIVVPASGWFVRLPAQLPQIRENVAPLIDFYANLQGFVDDTLQFFANNTVAQAQAVAVETPTSVLDYVTSSAPAAAVQIFFAVLLIYFFLAGWTQLRRSTIRGSGSFDRALHTARLIQNVVDATSNYLTTIVVINITLGLAVAACVWMMGMPSPLMWGGIVALCNFVPYVGPFIAAALLGMGGLMTFDSVFLALLPAIVQIVLHSVEANVVTPMVLGRRLTVNPILILVSLSFWGWVWGAPGAFLAIPLLIIIQTIVRSVLDQNYGTSAETVRASSAIDPPQQNAIGDGVGG